MKNTYQNVSEIQMSPKASEPRPVVANGKGASPAVTSDPGSNVYDDPDSPAHQPLADLDSPGTDNAAQVYDSLGPRTYSDANRYMTLPPSTEDRQTAGSGKNKIGKDIDNKLFSIHVTPCKVILFIVVVLTLITLSGFVGFYVCQSQIAEAVERSDVEVSGNVSKEEVRGEKPLKEISTNETNKECHSGSRKGSTKTFVFHGKLKLSFDKAIEYCKNQSQELVSVRDPRADLDLVQFIKEKGLARVWLQTRVSAHSCRGMTICGDTCGIPQYTHWARPMLFRSRKFVHPAADMCFCIMFTGRGWEPRDCFTRQNFVCQK